MSYIDQLSQLFTFSIALEEMTHARLCKNSSLQSFLQVFLKQSAVFSLWDVFVEKYVTIKFPLPITCRFKYELAISQGV